MNVHVGQAYRLYAKEPGTRQFSPLDVREGRLVSNLIYATILEARTPDDAYELEDHLEHLRLVNQGWSFEYRPVPGWKVAVH